MIVLAISTGVLSALFALASTGALDPKALAKSWLAELDA